MNDTRQRIVAAAEAMITEDPQNRPTVRSVAARAGCGASTLRHYFPTQRELFDAVLRKSFDEHFPDERIDDTSIPARDRLVECLTNLLTPIGEGEQAREFWMQLFGNLDGSARMESAFTNIGRVMGTRVESWLEVLEVEGAMPPGDRGRRALLLLTLIDGLSIGRAIPGGGPDRQAERGVLEDAVDAMLTPVQ